LTNAIARGVVRESLNAGLLDDTPRKELLVRTPVGRFGKLNELVGAAVFLASDSTSFVTGQILVLDGGFLVSGVNQ
jgi:NAD(P)-dependent dehydrogenase (short-subunit alcohol dehydrogenase family)